MIAPVPALDHLDIVVSSLDRSLPFYRELLNPLGWRGKLEQTGERGETIHYLWGPNARASLGLRERPPDAPDAPHDRYAVGVHHIAFPARSRKVVDERARWLATQDVTIESGPKEHDYTPGYYAVFFYDPDGLKLEIVRRPRFTPRMLATARKRSGN